MSRLLALVETLCGADARHRVFDPLIADWQREWRDAPVSWAARTRIIAGGSAALMLSIVQCLLIGGFTMPRAVVTRALAVLMLSTLSLVAAQIGLNALVLSNDFPPEMRFWMALPMVLPLVIPLSLLPIVMLMRGHGRVSSRGAVIVVCTGAIAAYLTAGWLTPLAQGDVRDEVYEEIYRRELARDARGEVTYPGTAVRQVRALTSEQRLAGRREWRQNPLYVQGQAERTRPQWGRRTLLTAALAVATGALGWAIGGLRQTSVPSAAGWWTLAWLTVMILDGRLLYPGNNFTASIGRAPYWMPLALFAGAAIVVTLVPKLEFRGRQRQ